MNVLLLLQVKNHMWLFVNCLVENPTFDSQTKENMTLQAKSFGSTCPLSDKFIKQVPTDRKTDLALLIEYISLIHLQISLIYRPQLVGLWKVS